MVAGAVSAPQHHPSESPRLRGSRAPTPCTSSPDPPNGDALYGGTKYNAAMALMTNGRVSNRGQTSLPAELRHRWGLDAGGDVAFLDLGDAALILPGGGDLARAELHRVLMDRYEIGIAALGDPDLSD